MPKKPNFELDYQSVTDIMACQTIEEVKVAVSRFIAATDEIRSEYNGMFDWDLCRHLTDALKALATKKPPSAP